VVLIGNFAGFFAHDLSTGGRTLLRPGAMAVASLLIVLWFRHRPGPNVNLETRV
jgi:hypothetical protein